MQFFCKFAIFLQIFCNFLIFMCLDIHSFVQFSKNQDRNKKVVGVKVVLNWVLYSCVKYGRLNLVTLYMKIDAINYLMKSGAGFEN